MSKYLTDRLTRWLFYIALALIIYMPLHVFIVQSASLVTGGIDAWKAAKDILLVGLAPLLLYLSHAQGLFKDKTFKAFLYVGGAYALIHLLFVTFDQSDDTYRAVVGSVYNVRLLGFLLLGYVVGSSKNAAKYLKYLLTVAVLIATAVAVFGVMQYFLLPHDLLESVGYTLDRGVKPLFFIDDNPDLPRVMSTLKDPNSLGSYLILPILVVGHALANTKVNKQLFIRPFRRSTLIVMIGALLAALLLTFSRGALLALLISIVTLLLITKRKLITQTIKRFWIVIVMVLIGLGVAGYVMRDSAFVQDYVFHAAETTAEADPNEKRLILGEEAVNRVLDEPLGYGPGSAGLVSINNPKGGFLTENYYLQIAHEVGWLGIALFLTMFVVLIRKLQKTCNLHSDQQTAILARIVLASLVGYMFYSFFIHLWSNEAVALQWWLLAGLMLGAGIDKRYD